MLIIQISVKDEIWLDPVEEEAQQAAGVVVLACMPALATVTSVRQVGSMLPNVAFEVWRIALPLYILVLIRSFRPWMPVRQGVRIYTKSWPRLFLLLNLQKLIHETMHSCSLLCVITPHLVFKVPVYRAQTRAAQPATVVATSPRHKIAAIH